MYVTKELFRMVDNNTIMGKEDVLNVAQEKQMA